MWVSVKNVECVFTTQGEGGAGDSFVSSFVWPAYHWSLLPVSPRSERVCIDVRFSANGLDLATTKHK